MEHEDNQVYVSVVEQRLSVNFETKAVRLFDKPDKGELPAVGIDEIAGAEFIVDLPDVVLGEELEQVHQLLNEWLNYPGEVKTTVMRGMANLHYHVDFAFNNDPDAAWATYRERLAARQRHYDVVVCGEASGSGD